MPYVIFSVNDQEIDRRELRSAVVIGRASQCEIAIRDIMMSRAHCRIEPQGENWLFTDLQSRNGTFIKDQRLEQAVLRDGDALRLGRTTMTFCAGPFKPAPQDRSVPPQVRPVDPNESFAGTVVGFELLKPGEAEYADGLPIPRPRLLEPAACANDLVPGMLDEIAGRLHDSIFQPALPPPRRPGMTDHARGNRTKRRLPGGERRTASAITSLVIGLVITAVLLAAQRGAPLPATASETRTVSLNTPDSPASPAAAVIPPDASPQPHPQLPAHIDPAAIVRAILYGLL